MNENYHNIAFNNAWKESEEEFACDHPEVKLTVLVKRNNARCYMDQCQVCGVKVKDRPNKQLSVAEKNAAKDFNQNLKFQWIEERRLFMEARRSEYQKTEKDDFMKQYSIYLSSPEWRIKRSLVLKRANGICEGCGITKATQVHHLTYVRLYKEMLFDLVAICDDCHQSLHEKK